MNYRTENLIGFINFIKDKKILCFGAGRQAARFVCLLDSWNLTENIIGFIDNNKEKINKEIQFESYHFPVMSLEKSQSIKDDVVIVICAMDFIRIKEQIESAGVFYNNICYTLSELPLNQLLVSDYPSVIHDTEKPVIPKKLHYAWFGDKAMPFSLKKNIEKWQELCPDYEIICWNESNYNLSKNTYLKEAYAKKQWAFISDYVRLDVVYEHGGIYLDTDVAILKKPDELLYQKGFTSFDSSFLINTAICGAVPRNKLIYEFRDYYDKNNFNGDACSICQYRVLKKYLFCANETLQTIEGINIYPMIFQSTDIFSMQRRISEKAFFAHYGTLRWLNENLHKQRSKIVLSKVILCKDLVSYADVGVGGGNSL